MTLQPLLSCSRFPAFPSSLREVPMGPKTPCGAQRCVLWFVPVTGKMGKEITARSLPPCQRVFQRNDALREKRKGRNWCSVLPTRLVSHRCEGIGRIQHVLPLALVETCWVPAPLLCPQAGLQESLRCFFCSWYCVIFCWKYAVDEKRSLVKCTQGPNHTGLCTQVKSGLLQFHHPAHLPKMGFTNVSLSF